MADFVDRLSEHVTCAANRMRRHNTYPRVKKKFTSLTKHDLALTKNTSVYSGERVLRPMLVRYTEKDILRLELNNRLDAHRKHISDRVSAERQKWRIDKYSFEGRISILPCLILREKMKYGRQLENAAKKQSYLDASSRTPARFS